MYFKVMGNNVEFSEEFVALNKIRVEFLNMSFNGKKNFYEKVKEGFKSFAELSQQGEDFAFEFLDSYIEKSLKILKDYDILSINKTEFENIYYGIYCTWFKEFDKLNEEYLLSKDSKFDLNTLKKEKREEWIVAEGKCIEELKFNMEAACPKSNSELLIDNECVNVKEIIKVENDEKEDLEFNNNLNILAVAMKESIFNIHFVILDILKKNEISTVQNYSDFVNIEKSNDILTKITNKEMENSNSESEEISIKKVIELNPYNEEIYKSLLIKYGDKDDEVLKIAEFLGYNNIYGYKIELLEKYYKEIPKETQQQIKISNEKIISYAEKLNIKDYNKWINISNKDTKAEALDELMEKYYSLDKKDKIKVCAIAAIICILLCYFITAMHFKNRFYYGTIINNINVVGKNVEEVTEELDKKVQNYKLVIELIDGSQFEIKSADIDLSYDFQEEVEKLKNEQNSFRWILGLFNESKHNLVEGVTYNEDKLNKIIDNLPCLDKEKTVEPQNAKLEYKDGKYEIIKEIEGNTVKYDILKESVVNSIKNKYDTLNLDDSNIYEKPLYTSESDIVVNAKSELDKYATTTIDYNIDGNKEFIDADIINTWLEINDEFIPEFKEDEIKKYLDKIALKYDKADNVREFYGKKFTTSKEIVTIDKDTETKELIELVKTGEPREREAKFINTTISENIINTFVEIDITKQHMWFYKNGELLTDGPVVTGNISKGHNTRLGLFKLYGKERNRMLKGDDYEVPVDFWMPFDGGIGIHDARWRSQFGGEIYKYNGSHGCVNSVYDTVQVIYNNIKIGDYVLVHY